MSIPDARYVVAGAGVHGLSTAWHLAKALRLAGKGDGRDVIVIDKSGVAAGASGIACGVIRNNYFQPAMRELMAHSVTVWESDPQAFAYRPVGYLQISPEVMHAGVEQIHREQRAIGYESVFIEGELESRSYLQGIFADWRAPGITSVLHEKRGGWASNKASMSGLAGKARAEGVRIYPGAEVTGLCVDGGAVTAVETNQGRIRAGQLVVAAGPWVRDFWSMLELPERITVTSADGHRGDRPMWTYWVLREGTLAIDPGALTDNAGAPAPVVHVDTDVPLRDDRDGSLITPELWGIYFKADVHAGGVQGGSMPLVVNRPASDVAVDPYGPASPAFVVGEDFARMWTSGLAHCLKRFEGKGHLFSEQPSGGIGCFTPDSFPVFDVFRQNAYVIADSNHGYKMIGVGALVARELLGEPQALLESFRFRRFEQGRLHPASHSPFPWS